MSSKCFCTSSTLCSGCQLLIVEGSNYGTPNYERVGPLPDHLFSHVHDGQYQPQSQSQSIQNVMVDGNLMNLEKHNISSTSTLQSLLDQTGGSQGPLLAPQDSGGQGFIKQQMLHNQHNGELSMTDFEPTIAQRLQEMSPIQPCPPNQSFYVPGDCAKRLIQYIHQLHRNADASKEFWREVFAEFFAPNARKKWCFSLCKNRPKQIARFAERMWNCQICKQNPSCGYEVTAEVLPTLSTVGYDTGILQELLYVDMPSEHQTVSGEIIVHYDKAYVHLVYENLRVVHDGQLCIVFTPDLKICSWDFCIRDIEQLISRKTLVPQVDKLQFLSLKYNHAAQNASPHLQLSELIRSSNELYEAACGFKEALNLPPVTDVGFTRRYLRFVQMSEVFTCMGDLIDHSLETGSSARMSLAILGGSSSEDGVPDSNRKRNRPLVQLADDPSNKYSEAAAETIRRLNFTRSYAAFTPSLLCSDPESSSSQYPQLLKRPSSMSKVKTVSMPYQ